MAQVSLSSKFQIKVASMEVYSKYESTNEPLDSSELEAIGNSGPYTNKREVSSRFALTEGAYVIVPACYETTDVGEFLVRIFTEKSLKKKYIVTSYSSLNFEFESSKSKT
jgi:hypothetical protein